jgi:hypothetical protein
LPVSSHRYLKTHLQLNIYLIHEELFDFNFELVEHGPPIMRHFFAILICLVIMLLGLPARADNLGAIGYGGLVFVVGAFLLAILVGIVVVIVIHRFHRKKQAPQEPSPEKQVPQESTPEKPASPKPAVILRLVCALAVSSGLASLGLIIGNLAANVSEVEGLITGAALIGVGLIVGFYQGWRWSWLWGVGRVLITVGTAALVALIGGTIANLVGEAEWGNVLIGTIIGAGIGAPLGFFLARKLLAKKS